MEVHEKQVVTDPATGSESVHEAVHHVITPAEQRAAQVEKKNQLIWYIFGLINTLIFLRFVFLLLGAANVGFTELLYSATHPLVAPFRGIFPSPDAGSYFETASIVAIVVYSLVGWGLSALIDVLMKPATNLPQS